MHWMWLLSGYQTCQWTFISIHFHDFLSHLHDFRTSVQVKQDDIFMISAVARLWEYWKSLKTIESDCKCSIFRIWLLLTIAIIVIVTINDYHCHYYYYYYPLRIVIITINDWHPNFPFWQIPAVPAQLTDGFTCPGSPSRCNLPQKNCGRTKMSCWGPSKAPWWSKDLFIWLWVNTY